MDRSSIFESNSSNGMGTLNAIFKGRRCIVKHDIQQINIDATHICVERN